MIVKEPIQLTVGKPQSDHPSLGRHGFDPAHFPTMRAIFVATGPNISKGVKLGPVENTGVMPFMATILNVKLPQGLDGSAKSFHKALLP